MHGHIKYGFVCQSLSESTHQTHAEQPPLIPCQRFPAMMDMVSGGGCGVVVVMAMVVVVTVVVMMVMTVVVGGGDGTGSVSGVTVSANDQDEHRMCIDYSCACTYHKCTHRLQNRPAQQTTCRNQIAEPARILSPSPPPTIIMKNSEMINTTSNGTTAQKQPNINYYLEKKLLPCTSSCTPRVLQHTHARTPPHPTHTY